MEPSPAETPKTTPDSGQYKIARGQKELLDAVNHLELFTTELLATPAKEQLPKVPAYLDIFTTFCQTTTEFVKHSSSDQQTLIRDARHDISNLLAGVAGLISIDDANEKLQTPSLETTQSLITIRRYLLELRTLKPKPFHPEPTTIDDLLSYIAGTKRHIEMQGISVNVHTSPAQAIYADPWDLSRALRNTVTNAADAARESYSRPTVSITARTVYLMTPANTGLHVAILIDDNGQGIAPENLERVAEPYFTTKKTGTGVGLSIVSETMQRNNGAYAIESHPPHGTRVTLFVPARPPKAQQPPA